MKKSQLTLEDIQALHQAGHLAEAERAYLDMLEKDSANATVLHFLGILYTELGRLDAAQHCIEQAIQIEPNNPVFKLHLANVLKATGLFDQATAILIAITQSHPHFAAAFNNLGIIYYRQEKIPEAVAAFQSAIDRQTDYADAYYNLGLALRKSGRFDEAFNAYHALLELSPQHAAGQFQLGCLLMQQSKYKDAVSYFIKIEKEHPHHVETQTNLASCYLALGRLSDAKTHYLKALALMPNDTQILFNLGVIHMQQGDINEAVKYYLQSVQIQPDFFEAQYNLGVAYMAMQNVDAALSHFHQAQSLQPNNEAVRHIIHILASEKKLSASPPEYISSLFDSYADHYDSHLKEALHYQVPQLIYQAVQTMRHPINASLDILDLGCGTGLCGELLKPIARSLTGIDLSKNMLEIAAQKHIYDKLIQADISAFLTDKIAAYDLIIAGDVLVYIGDLTTIFPLVSQALRQNGLFIFNAEINQTEDYHMTASGRFAHSEPYLRTLAEQNHFHLTHHQTVTLRTQNGTNVQGYLVGLEKY